MENRKLYALLLCENEPEEEIVYAELTDDQAEMIRKDIRGEVLCELQIRTTEGEVVDGGIVDRITEVLSIRSTRLAKVLYDRRHK